jgi:Lipid A 3-O-deacylase (PagL)
MKYVLIFLVAICNYSFAQSDSAITSYGISYVWGKTLVHTTAVENIRGAKPTGFAFEIAKERRAFNDWNLATAFVKTGYAFNYINYNSPIVGEGFIVSRFIQPNYRLSNNLSVNMRASIGLAYLTKPNTNGKNTTNNNYSLYVNPYLHIGGGISYNVSKHINIEAQANFNHISNGNIQQPNKGINWGTYQIGINYTGANNAMPKYKLVKNKFWKGKQLDVEIGLMLVPKQGYYKNWMAQRKSMTGVFGQVTKQVGRVSALRLGVDVYYNNWKIDETAPDIKSGWVAGVHFGHVFLLGKINFSQQIGYNVYNKASFHSAFYTRWGLDYKLTNHYSIGASLKANDDNADFFDVRVGYKF